eukprot:3765435-Prymnesium_polylepis.1
MLCRALLLLVASASATNLLSLRGGQVRVQCTRGHAAVKPRGGVSAGGGLLASQSQHDAGWHTPLRTASERQRAQQPRLQRSWCHSR